MNFLAHLHLAEATPESRMGNLLGDFVKGRPYDERFSPEIWKGIMEHRHVDAFTDKHPVWRMSRDRLPRELRRFAGIIIDIVYDHFLVRHWDRFSPRVSLSSFVEATHEDLLESMHLAPDDAAEVILMMMQEEWLEGYASLKGIKETLRRVSGRSASLTPMRSAFSEVLPWMDEMEGHFLDYYPELMEYVDSMRSSTGKLPQA